MSDVNDDYVKKEVQFTSFIENHEENDILVFLKNGRFLVFDISGKIIEFK